MFRHTLLKLMVSASMVLAAGSAFAENRIALVIGQSAYRSVPALPNPANDAKAVTQMLTDFGFEVSTAADLSQSEMRQQVSEFAGKVAAKGADTVALVFYAGHGLQIDGENYLVPVDIDPKREADIPIQAVRLNDILNTLTSVPSKMRILMLDACRNNPFPDLSKTSGGGLAIVDAKIGSPGTFLSFSTSPGAVAEDGSGANSPYTSALLSAGKESGIPIEETFKRVRLAVNKATDGRQTPWDSSSLTDDFRFLGPAVAGPKLAATKKSVAEWTRDLKGKPVEQANEIIVADGSDESYEAFAGLYRANAARAIGARLARPSSPHGGLEQCRHHQHGGRLSRLPGKIPRQRSHRDGTQAGTAAAQPPRLRPRRCRRGRGSAKRRADLSLQPSAGAAAAVEEGRCAAQER